MTKQTILAAGPLEGDRLLDVWPRLKPYVAAAIDQQDPEVRDIMVAVLTADASRIKFEVVGLKVVASIADRPILAVPLVALTEDERSPREAH